MRQKSVKKKKSDSHNQDLVLITAEFSLYMCVNYYDDLSKTFRS